MIVGYMVGRQLKAQVATLPGMGYTGFCHPAAAWQARQTNRAKKKIRRRRGPNPGEDLDEGSAWHVRMIEYEIPDREGDGKAGADRPTATC